MNTEEYENALKKASSDTNAFADKLKSGFDKVAKVGAAAMGAATAAVTAFTVSSIKTGMEFDSAMSQVAAVSGATGEDFDLLREKAMEMGASTKFSASEAAEAMNYMAMAGWKTEDMLGGIEGIMNLAAASGESLASTSDIVTDALTAFGLSAEDSGHFADVLAVASSNANTNVSMMGATFKYVAPLAGALGYSVDDAAVAIGLMANAGIKAEQAGTSLRAILTRLSTNAGQTSTSLGALDVLTRELGVEFYNVDGSTRDLMDVLLDSRDAWSGLTEEEQVNYATTIAGQEAMSGWLAIMNAAPADLEKLSSSITDANGAALNMANIMQDNLAGDLTIFNSTLEGVQTTLFDKLSPALREGTQFMTDLAKSAQEFIEEGGIEKIIQLFTDLTPVISGVTAAVVAYKAAMAISSIVDAATKTVKAYQAANEGATVAQALLNTTILKNPFALIVSLIASVVTALVTLYMTNEDFRNKVNAAWQSVKDTISGVVNAVVTFFTETVPTAGREMLDFFKSIPDMALQWGKDLIDNFVNGIKSKVEDVKNAVSNVASTVKDFLGFSEPEKGPLSNFHTYAPDMMQLFASGIRENAGLLKSAFDDSLNFGTKNVDFGTANVDFASSAVGQSSAAIVNSVSGGGENSGAISLTINLLTGDGDKFASWLLPDLIAAADAAGTPIASGRYA